MLKLPLEISVQQNILNFGEQEVSYYRIRIKHKIHLLLQYIYTRTQKKRNDAKTKDAKERKKKKRRRKKKKNAKKKKTKIFKNEDAKNAKTQILEELAVYCRLIEQGDE